MRYQEEKQLEEQRAQVGARMKQYEDELARKRMMADHELQRQRNAESVKLQEDAHARQEGERLRIEQQIQAERRAAEQYAVSGSTAQQARTFHMLVFISFFRRTCKNKSSVRKPWQRLKVASVRTVIMRTSTGVRPYSSIRRRQRRLSRA